MDNKKTLILVDGHALAFRQYFALERTNMRTSDGMPTWAVYGFFKAIFDLLKKQKPDAICVAFDVSHQTFRVEKYNEYKANREAMPDNMRCQMDLIYEGLKAFNIPIYTKEGFEADDVIGTIAKQACELGHKVLILTGDQDSFQLIDKDGCTKVIIPYKSELTEFDWNKVYEKLGVYPNQVVDYKSLRGDTSDNIPGVRGIGEKTAVRLLSEFGNLENILANCENVTPGCIRQKLCDDIEMAKLSYFLATIVRDVDVHFDFDGAKVELPDIHNVTAFLKKMQFYTFLKNIDSILSSFNSKDAIPTTIVTDLSPKQGGQLQLGLFAEAVKAEINKGYDYETKLIDNIDELKSLIADLSAKKIFAIKSDFTSKNAVENDLKGVSLALCDDFVAGERVSFGDKNSQYKIFYVSFEKLAASDILPLLKPTLENTDIKKITYDAKSEINLWHSLGIKLNGVNFDVLLASYVKDMSKNHSLTAQAFDRIDYIIDDAVNSQVSVVSLLENTINLDYASEIIIAIFELTKYWVNNLDEAESKLLYDLEIPLTYVLSDMESFGVSVDRDYLTELSEMMNKKSLRLESQIFKLADESFNISSPKQVGHILFEKLGLVSKTKHKKLSTSAEVLEELAEDYEIAKLILEYRKFAKLKSTYTDALPELISPVDNRIHTTYNQTVTATGRLSSSNPNLQNIPVRTSDGAKIRKAFVPADKENQLILSADYSQIELRLLAHISQDKHLISAFKSGEDVHALTASKVFAVPFEEVTKEMRYKAKAVNFGIVYGQSKYGLSKALGISKHEAGVFIDKYFETYPKIKKYMTKKVDEAEKNGYVPSLFGRKRYLAAEFNSSNVMVREFAKRAAINYPMQSSASDLIKFAMVDLAKKMVGMKSKLIMQVHDELILEVYKDELETVKEMVRTAMELGQPLDVPLVVDISVGETWQDS